MPYRAPSPALSENEIDISRALFDHGSVSGSDDDGAQQHPDRKKRMLAPEAMLDLAASASEDEGFIAAAQAASNRKASNLKGRTVKKGGGFQALGLNANLLKAITRKGFTVPTPIQRKTIPLVLDSQDVVGMARTGSGKTAAFVIPMIEKLKAHSAKVGARALILSPSRELALQTLKVVKELGRGTDLKCVLLVGGDSLEEQFGFMTGNPDIVIATPGRFLHLKVEMGLDLSSIRYVVFDEADRLFEMGFAAQLTEILHALPQQRQTLLFSATLPKSLVEFARAGLQEPSLVRLDAESKISPELENAFFTVKSAEKEGALLHILNDIIEMPTGQTEAANRAKEDRSKHSKKRKRNEVDGLKTHESPTAHSTIIFTATKHHVDYIASLLRLSGFAVSHAYGSLDQTARKMQVQDFRTGMTNILVVTDVAARGIDIPVLANVINYDFPAQPKIFVHRVGRTARAGQRGWSYSLVRESDAPYLLDLQLFLGKRLILGRDGGNGINYAEDVVVGSVIRDRLERSCEWVTRLLDEDSDLLALRSVAGKGEKLYLRTRNSASSESAKRSKEIVTSKNWMALHPLFNGESDNAEIEREKMLARVSGFRPQETVFEIGKRGANGEAAEVMRRRRGTIKARKRKHQDIHNDEPPIDQDDNTLAANDDMQVLANAALEEHDADMDSASEEKLEVTFTQSTGPKGKNSKDSWKDSEHFMSYTPSSINLAEDRGYGVHSGSYNTASQNSNFVEAARGVTMDLNNDDGAKAFAEPSKSRGMRWDKKNKKYVARANDEDGSKGAKMIRGESGQKIAASFRSGRFDAWRKSNKVDRLPRTGEAEVMSNAANRGLGKRFKHKLETAPKDADKYRDDYYKRKKQVEAAKEKRIGRFKDGKGKSELRGVDDVRKERSLKEKRKEKNARPTKKRKF
ncbi:atp-dependent rna helicase dbp10 [Lasallia pustulata]|uniref:RNA helicase n=1 Tax=Lasallia pustulata TaxID=136370 RepID=A0A1W5DBL9_9LECA|nr:atp-dependent rna helicase dbp10 [Lasallia pustulata]